MKYLIVRDDDVNYFTEPDLLERLYGFMKRMRVPMHHSVIPNVNSATRRYPYSESAKYEDFIPNSRRGVDSNHSIVGNRPLLEYLNREYIRCLLHGYSHMGNSAGPEFMNDDQVQIGDLVSKGNDIHKQAFGEFSDVFVAPQDAYSRNALSVISKKFKYFSTGWVDKTKLNTTKLPEYYLMKILKKNYMNNEKSMLIEHPGCLFSKYKAAQDSSRLLQEYLRQYKVTILVVHHWEFLNSDYSVNTGMHNRFMETITKINADAQIRIIGFSDLSSII